MAFNAAANASRSCLFPKEKFFTNLFFLDVAIFSLGLMITALKLAAIFFISIGGLETSVAITTGVPISERYSQMLLKEKLFSLKTMQNLESKLRSRTAIPVVTPGSIPTMSFIITFTDKLFLNFKKSSMHLIGMIKAAIFDLDGLLIDSEPLHFAAWKRVYENHGHMLDKKEYTRFVGIGDMAVGKYIASKFKLNLMPEELVKEKKNIYFELIKDVKFIDGAVELIKSFKSRGVMMALASSDWRKTVNRILENSGYEKLFDVVICGDDVKEMKPSPEIYLLTAKKLHTRPEECIAFEDSYSGVIAAKNAGIFCIAVPNKYTKRQRLPADMIRNSLKEISVEEILRKD